MKSILKKLLVILPIVYLAILAGLYFFQEKLLFHPQKLGQSHKFEFRFPVEEKNFEMEGEKINTILFRAPKSETLIVYFHGNAGNLEMWGIAGEELMARLKTSVWLIDYPGYGKSEGKIHSEAQLHAVAAEFLKIVKAEFPAAKLVVFGRSIGTGLAAQIATDPAVSALILESPFYSLNNLVAEMMPWAPTAILRYQFPTYLWLPKIKAPILILHGKLDELIPYSQGEKLAPLLNPRSRFIGISSGHHNDLSESEEYWDGLREFLEKI